MSYLTELHAKAFPPRASNQTGPLVDSELRMATIESSLSDLRTAVNRLLQFHSKPMLAQANSQLAENSGVIAAICW